MSHTPWGAASGTLGVQFARRDFDAIGEEAFVPPTLTTGWALFAFEEIGRGPVRLQLGARYDRQSVEAQGGEPMERDEDGFSGSVGLSYRQGDAFTAGLTVARSVKLPTAEELFSNGPHIATRSFEVGDPDLRQEKSLGVDLSVRGEKGRVAVLANAFLNRFDDYIFQELTGEEEDGLPVLHYVQGDARFYGVEGEVTVDLLHAEPHHLDLELGGDYVRAERRDAEEDLPRIPPARLHAGLHYAGRALSARAEVRRVMEQERLAPFERPTDGYTSVNASLSYRLFLGERVLDLILRGTNLADEEARNHVSFLKDLAPLPGRDVRLSARLTF
jgi:iron complex outermembrane receptor protein